MVLVLTLKLLVNIAVSEMARASSVVELTVLYAATQRDLFYGANIYLDKVPLLVHWQDLSLAGMRAVAGTVVAVSTGNDYYGNLLPLSYFCLTL